MTGPKGEPGTVLGGVGMLDMWYVESTISVDTDNVPFAQTPETLGVATRGLIRDNTNQMSYTNGNGSGHGFSFPKTGIYIIESTFRFKTDTTVVNADHYAQVQMSNDGGSNWQPIKEITAWHPNQAHSSQELYQSLHGKTTVKISDITLDRVRIKYNTGNPSNPDTTPSQLIGNNSVHSFIYFTRAGLPGEAGVTGMTGMTGYQGLRGAQGFTGDKGEPGSDGSFGGASFDYTFSTAIVAPTAPHTNGQIRLNDSTQSSSTILYIDDADDNGADVDTFMTTIHNVNSTPKGFVRISSGSNNNVFHLFQITQTTNQGDYWEVVITNQTSSTASPFNDGDDIIVSFVTNGNKGQKGEKGSTGNKGEKGNNGEKGSVGNKGEKGQKGEAGSKGEKGEKGQKGEIGNGEKGQKGEAGSKGEKGEKGQKGEIGNGEKGQKGEAGSKGEKGEKGQKGEIGNGEKGQKGERGPQGFTGFTGMTGAQGFKGSQGSQGFTGYTGMTGYQGMKGAAGDAGTKSSMLRLVMKDNFTLVSDSYYGVPFSKTHSKYESGNIWSIIEGDPTDAVASATIITVTESITASIKFAGTIFIPDGNTNKNSFLRLSYKPNGGSWNFIPSTKVAFGFNCFNWTRSNR